MIIIAFGSRSLSERQDAMVIVDRAFRIFYAESGLFTTLVKYGDARGADILMAQWAKDMKIEVQPFPAKWNDWAGLPKDKKKLKRRADGSQYNALAGFNRNQEMIDSGFDAALCIRMPGHSPGTDDMIERVKLTKKPLMVFHVDGEHEWIKLAN